MMMWPWTRRELDVLVVCSANVCRSPPAEALLRRYLRGMGLERVVRVRSCGTQVAAPGRPPDPRMIAIAAEDGLSLRGIRARQVSAKLLDGVGHIWVMEPEHLDALQALFPDANLPIDLIDPLGQPVPDPYYSSKAAVRDTYERLAQITHGRAKELCVKLRPSIS